MRSDTPYSDLYERTQDLSALAQAAAEWALGILECPRSCPEAVDVAGRTLRLAMRYRREMRDKRNLILQESFKREVCGG